MCHTVIDKQVRRLLSVKFLLFVLSVSFTLNVWGERKLIEGVIAVVNNHPILLSDYQQAKASFLQSVQNRGEINKGDVLRDRILDHMIMMRLQSESAENNAIRVNTRELNSQIELMAQHNRLSVSQLYDQIQKSGQSVDDFRHSIMQQMIVSRLQQRLFASRIQVSEQEVDELFLREQNINDPYEYQLAQLLFSPKNNDQASWRQLSQSADAIYLEIEQGLPFDQAVLKYADLNETLSQSLDKRWQDVDSLPDVFHQAIVSLKVGQITSPIKTGRGFFILQLEDKQHKKKTSLFRYQFEQIFLSLASYDADSAGQIWDKVKTSLSDGDEDFSEFAQQFSQDQYALQDGQTGWLSATALHPSLSNRIKDRPLNQLDFVLTDGGWLIYRLVNKERYDATEEVQKRRIEQKLLHDKTQEEYAIYLRNLRSSAAISIYVESIPN